MQYEIEIGGRTRQVAVTRVGDQFAVTVDGRTSHVNATRVDPYTLSLLIESAEGAHSGDASAPSGDLGGSHVETIAPDRATRKLSVRVGTTRIAVGLNGSLRW